MHGTSPYVKYAYLRIYEYKLHSLCSHVKDRDHGQGKMKLLERDYFPIEQVELTLMIRGMRIEKISVTLNLNINMLDNHLFILSYGLKYFS